MIPTHLRLTAQEVRYALKKGDSISSEFFIVRYIKNTEEQNSKFAVITSNKLSPKAVERNLVRRRTYEAIRLKKDDDVKCKLVLIPKKKTLKTEYKNIEDDIINIFTQLKQNGQKIFT